MDELYFITGNPKKLEEVSLILPEIKSLALDLPEIQSLDPRQIIRAKIKAAEQNRPSTGTIIVEDVSLFITAMNGLPGPLIKWFLQTVGPDGIYKLIKSIPDKSAKIVATLGVSSAAGELSFFESTVEGDIVEPSPDLLERAFGFDPIFRPQAMSKTYAEMSLEEKNQISHRRLVWQQFADSLKH